MEMRGLTIGFALTGSFCTFTSVIPQIQKIVDNGGSVLPLMSYNAYTTNTRFGDAKDFVGQIEKITGNIVVNDISGAEAIGPNNLLDVFIVAPCTGNTLSKIANSITDTSVTMAVKATLRNNKPVVIALSTNDGLSGNAKNIGTLLARKNIFFVPFGQDNAQSKPSSLVAKMDQIIRTVELAIQSEQIQPILQ